MRNPEYGRRAKDLRIIDHFAGLAMQALIARGANLDDTRGIEDLVNEAFELGEAMARTSDVYDEIEQDQNEEKIYKAAGQKRQTL